MPESSEEIDLIVKEILDTPEIKEQQQDLLRSLQVSPKIDIALIENHNKQKITILKNLFDIAD